MEAIHDDSSSSQSLSIEKIVGVIFSDEVESGSGDWYEYVASSLRYIETSLEKLLSSGDSSCQDFQVDPIQQNGTERVVLKLEGDTGVDEDLVSHEYLRIREICLNVADVLREAQVDNEYLRRLSIGAAWQGSLFVLLEAPSSVMQVFFSEFSSRGNRVELSNSFSVVGFAPAFVVAAVQFDVSLDEIRNENADAVIWKGLDFTLLVPTSVVAFDKLVMGGMEYWRKDSDEGWRTMPTIVPIEEIRNQVVPVAILFALASKNEHKSESGESGSFLDSSPDVSLSSASKSSKSRAAKLISRVMRSRSKHDSDFSSLSASTTSDDETVNSKSSFSSGARIKWNSKKHQDKSVDAVPKVEAQTAPPDGISESKAKEIEILTWFTVKDDFPAKYQALFQVPSDELLSQGLEHVTAWLQQVEAAYKQIQEDESMMPIEEEKAEEVLDVNVIQVLTWFRLRDHFDEIDQELFHTGEDDLLRWSPDEVDSWLRKAQAAWDRRQNINASASFGEAGVGANDIFGSDGITASGSGVGNTVSPAGENNNASLEREIEVRTWYAMQNELHVFNNTLFETSAEERLQQPPDQLDTWLRHVESSWDQYRSTTTELPHGLIGSGHVEAGAEAFAEAAVDDDSDTTASSSDDSTNSTVLAIEVRTWFSLQNEFNLLDQSLFQVPASDVLRQHPEQIRSWLRQVEAAWGRYQVGETTVSTNNETERDQSSSDEDKEDDSVVNAIEVRTWFSVQNEFHALDQDLFQIPIDQRLRQSNRQVKAWLQNVQSAWEKYQRNPPPRPSPPPGRIGVDTDDPVGVDTDVSFNTNELPEYNLSTAEQMEVRTWYSLQAEFHAMDEALFNLSEEERLGQPSEQLNVWLRQVERSWDRTRGDLEEMKNEEEDTVSNGSTVNGA